MKTTSGLPNGSFVYAKSTGGARRDTPPRARRTREARKVKEGDRLRGQRTLDIYEVLAVEDAGQLISLTVMNTRTSDVRRWRRAPGFHLEVA